VETWHSRCEHSATDVRLFRSQESHTRAMPLIIVKRGALSTFRFLEQSCRDLPGLRVIWDRRRGSSSLGGRERRGNAPLSWTAADHVFAPVDPGEPLEPVMVEADSAKRF
jgi:hypothetical protein